MHTNENKIFVTKSFLPDFEEYIGLLRGIFDRCILTNQGPLVQKLEKSLKEWLSLKHLQYVCNGTAAMQLAIRALGLEGTEIITTPFSYVASSSCLLWEGCRPVYVDIEPRHFTIDPEQVEAAITPETRAILAVHVFGYHCDVEKLENIARLHNLKIIYDAAHAFGAKYKGQSLLNYGDISTLSFHATKLYHTIEGGACICREQDVDEKIDLLKRFGHMGDKHYCLGINAKQSEFHAAMGLTKLMHIDDILQERKRVCIRYNELIDNYLYHPPIQANAEWNYAYYPVLFNSFEQREHILQALARQNIFARRYFYPSLNTLPYMKEQWNCPNSEDICRRVACLPLYDTLEERHIERIARIIRENL